MLKVGLTGGIGSGKSTVAELFTELKIPVYEADLHAKKLMTEDVKLRDAIIEIFGKEVYKKGVLNRKYLASIVFNDKGKLNRLNSLVHPAVRKDYLKWSENQTTHYTIREAAILFESGSYKDCDVVILVTAPEDVRIQRVMDRDGSSEADVKSRIDKQWKDEKKRKWAQYIINNDGSVPLDKQVLKIHKALLKLKK